MGLLMGFIWLMLGKQNGFSLGKALNVLVS